MKSDWIDVNEELLAEIDTTTRKRHSKNVRKGDIAHEGDREHTNKPVLKRHLGE